MSEASDDERSAEELAPALADLGRTLSDSFCRGLDRQAILAAIRERQSGREAPATLSACWGIRDTAVLRKLESLGLTTETVAAISLTPLVAIAWADGRVDKKERTAVLEAAERYGLSRADVSYLLLEGRLGERPDEALLQTWKTYIRLLARLLDRETLRVLRGEVMSAARNVAEASGGLLGLGSKVSRQELALLDELERAFP